MIYTANFDTQLDSLLQLYKLYFTEEGRECQWNREEGKKFFLESDTTLVAQYDGQVVGFCCVHIGTVGVIYLIFVHPEYRRQGIGTSLMVRACDYIRSQGCSQAYLGVNAENKTAIAFYKKLGFYPTRINMAKEV